MLSFISAWQRSSGTFVIIKAQASGLRSCFFDIGITKLFNMFFRMMYMDLLIRLSSKPTHHPDFLPIEPQNKWTVHVNSQIKSVVTPIEFTYAGQPSRIATQAIIESPLPYPNLSYMIGAKRGKPKPAADLKNNTAAIADAAWREKQSRTNIWMAWKFRIMPPPTRAIPCEMSVCACIVSISLSHDVSYDPMKLVLGSPPRQE